MTNKIYLSFNRLYTLKDGDYGTAKLSFRIKHADQVLFEGERIGKSFSQFIVPITIEEIEIIQPLTVEYICTGNVEDVAVSLEYPAHKPFHVVDGYIFIKDASIQKGWLSDCKKVFGSDTLPFGGCPIPKTGTSDQREMKSPDELTEKVKAIIREQLRPDGLLYRK
ncbi:hypothetical protein [Rahnella aquatilis]|uniref:hypothetical protein n=1 Tax=Rahnella aquatilis TaxID=34038 RepID=UPI003665BFB5